MSAFSIRYIWPRGSTWLSLLWYGLLYICFLCDGSRARNSLASVLARKCFYFSTIRHVFIWFFIKIEVHWIRQARPTGNHHNSGAGYHLAAKRILDEQMSTVKRNAMILYDIILREAHASYGLARFLYTLSLGTMTSNNVCTFTCIFFSFDLAELRFSRI